MPKKFSRNVKTVLDVLKDEVRGNVRSALEKMAKDYTMTWMYKGKNKLFPKNKKNLKSELEKVYTIKGHRYEIKNIAEGEDVVMVELVESYPNPKTKKIYRTPLVLVLEMKNGKIKRGRHYCDPRLSFMNLTERQLERVYGKKSSGFVIK